MKDEKLCLGCMAEKTEQPQCPHCGWQHDTAPDNPLHLRPGTVLQGKYLIGRVLGQGGFGITYLAWDVNLNMKLAIKEYLPQGLVYRSGDTARVSLQGKQHQEQFGYGLEKFLDEARTLARFERHPNIVTVRDFFRDHGTAYMVMSYLEGVTLENHLVLSGGKFDYTKTLAVIMPVLDALKEVHDEGIMHRDISPDNILIDTEGRVILIDFGAARQDLKDKSKSLSVIVKAGYAPEEQYRSKGQQGPWTDIYAVAATMYRMLVGQVPPDSLDRLNNDELIPPGKLGVEMPDYAERTLLKALAVRASERYHDVKSFQKNLQYSNSVEAEDEIPKENPFEKKNAESLKDDKETSTKYFHHISRIIADAPVSVFDWQEINYFDLKCPVEAFRYKINKPKGSEAASVVFVFRNLSSKKVVALDFEIHCFDSFGEPVVKPPANIIKGIIQDQIIQPGKEFGEDIKTDLSTHEKTRKVFIEIKRVLFSDGGIWHRGVNNFITVCKEKELYEQELFALKKVAGKEAVCYAREEDEFWQCTCGRGNLADANICIRCGLKKDFLMQLCSSEEKVSAELEHRRRREEEEEQNRREQKEREKRKEKEQRVKALKIIIPSAIVMILAWAGITLLIPHLAYNNAIALMEAGDFLDAVEAFEELDGYKDSEQQIKKAQEILMEEGEYKKAIETFSIDADYIIDYKRGTIPLSELEIGARVADLSWVWEHRTGPDKKDGVPYSGSGVTKPVTWILVADNHYSGNEAGSVEGGASHLTLLAEEIIAKHPFDNSTNRGSEYGSNHWGDSGKPDAAYGIRKFLNGSSYTGGDINSYSHTFYDAMSADFKSAILTTTLPNKVWDTGASYETNDKIFLPSTTELGDKEHAYTYKIGSDWGYFSDDNSRRAAIDGNNWWFRARSPLSGHADYVRSVSAGGGFSNRIYAYHSSGGVRPALNLKSEILVSEIK